MIHLVDVPETAFEEARDDLIHAFKIVNSYFFHPDVRMPTINTIFKRLGLTENPKDKELRQKERQEKKRDQAGRMSGAIIANALLKEEKQVKLKPMSRWKTFGLLMVVAGLLAMPPEIQAQEPNFAWITDTNGITWREKIEPPVPDPWPQDWPDEIQSEHLILRNDPNIAEVVVPEHASIGPIDVRGCINLTNLIIKPKQVTRSSSGLEIYGYGSGLRNITAPRTMINSIRLRGYRYTIGGSTRLLLAWVLAIQWTELEPELPKVEMRMRTTVNGKEMEIVWGDGTLQIADAVQGEWRDHFGTSPLRFPIATESAKFFRIKRNR